MPKTAWVASVLIGLGLLGVTVWLVLRGISQPSPGLSAAIALSSAIAAPIGLVLISAGVRGIRGPNAAELRAAARAKESAARAVEELNLKAEALDQLEAFLTWRASVLDYERRLATLKRAAQDLREEMLSLDRLAETLGKQSSDFPDDIRRHLEELVHQKRYNEVDPWEFETFMFIPVPTGLMRQFQERVRVSARRRQLRKAEERGRDYAGGIGEPPGATGARPSPTDESP